MEYPFRAALPGIRARIFIPLVVLWALASLCLLLTNQPLRTAAAPWGLVSLAMSGDPISARWIIQSWTNNDHLLPLACFAVGLSFLWLAAGSTALCFACVWSAQQMPYRKWASLCYALAWGQWIGGLVGTGVSAALLPTLLGRMETTWSLVAWLGTDLAIALFALGAIVATAGIPVRDHVKLFPGRFQYVPR